jgi:hypothetical protein
MKIKTIVPVLLSSSLDEIVYSCPACHIERKRNVMRGDRLAEHAARTI